MRSIAVGVMMLSCAGAVAAQTRLARPVSDVVDGHVPRVTNAAPSQWTGTGGWRLVLVATIQPPDGTPGDLINPELRGPSLHWDGAERLVVTDSKPAALKRYDSTGHFLGVLGREGDGPGEYRDPFVAARGTRLIAHNPRTGLVTTYDGDRPGVIWHAETDAEGWPVHLDSLYRFYNLTALPDPVTHLLRQNAWLRWPASRWHGSDAAADTIRIPYEPPSGVLSWTIPSWGRVIKPFLNQVISIIDRGGRMIWGNTATSVWYVMANGRDTSRIVRISDDPPSFTMAARDSVVRDIAERLPDLRQRFLAIAKGSDLPDRLPAWREITEDGRGTLWITRYASDATISRFDLVDPSGRWIGSVAAPRGFGRAFAIGHDHVADLVEGDDGRPAVRIFRIDRSHQ
jgi:hypothetical protein